MYLSIVPLLIGCKSTEKNDNKPKSPVAPPSGSIGSTAPVIEPEESYVPNAELSQYINSLDYDPRVVLAVNDNPTTVQDPYRDRATKGDEVIICNKTRFDESKNLDEISILSTKAGVIFPGALILANDKLVDGKPTPIVLKRGPARLTLDLPGLQTPGFDLRKLSNSEYTATLNKKLQEWVDFVDASDNPEDTYQNAAKMFMSVENAYNKSQIAIALNIKGNWGSAEISSALDVKNSTEQQTVVALYKQVYYSVTMDTPETPSHLFASDVSLDQAKASFSNQSPPAYVRTVDYGRSLVIQMQTTKIESETDVKLAFQYATGTKGIDIEQETKIKNIIENSTFRIMAIGGNSESAAQVYAGNSEESLAAMVDYISQGAKFSPSNPGVPIAYTVAFVKGNVFGTLGLNAEYTLEECVTHPLQYVNIHHAGAYILKDSELSWKYNDEAGQLSKVGKWNKNEWTAQGPIRVNLPGDAQDIRFKSRNYTGLVWDPIKQVCDIKVIPNKTILMEGTTLGPSCKQP